MRNRDARSKIAFALKKSIICLVAAGFSQTLLAAMTPPTLQYGDDDPSGLRLAKQDFAGYGGFVNLAWPSVGANVQYTVESSLNPDMSGASRLYSWVDDDGTTARTRAGADTLSPANVDPVNWQNTPNKFYYQVTATDPSTGESVKSNILDINVLAAPFFVNASGRYVRPDNTWGGTERHVTAYVAPNAGKTKVGQALIYAPAVPDFLNAVPTIEGGTNGTLTKEGNDLYFTPSAGFGSGANAAQPEVFTITYPDEIDGMSTGYGAAGITISVVPYNGADAAPPTFKLFYGNYDNADNATILGDASNPIWSFSQTTPEPNPVVNGKDGWTLRLVQTGGQSCPLFMSSWEATDYMTKTGLSKACLVEDAEPSKGYISYIEASPSLPDAIYNISPNAGVDAHITAGLMGSITPSVKVSQLSPTGDVLGTQTLTYSASMIAPQTFTYNLVPTIRKIGDLYLVTNPNVDFASYQITSGDPANAYRAPLTPLVNDWTPNFSTGYVPAFVLDKRDAATAKYTDWNMPDGASYASYFVALKETIPLTTQKNADGSIAVYINANHSIHGGYKFTLTRIDSKTGYATVPEDDATFMSGWNGNYGNNVNNSSGDYYKTLSNGDGNAKVTISAATLQSVKDAGDVLTIHWDALVDSRLPVELREDPDLVSNYFSGNLTIDGFAGAGAASGNLSTPALMWRGASTNAIKVAGVSNTVRVDWTITRVKTGAQIVDTRNDASSYDVSAMASGAYTVQARLYNVAGQYIDTDVVSFTIYDRPTATVTIPTMASRGKSYPLTAVTSGVPQTAKLTWVIGGQEFPAAVNALGTEVTGTYSPTESTPNGNLPALLRIQVDPAVAESMIEFPATGTIAVGDTPGGTISTAAKVFWAGKSQLIDFTPANSATTRIDWLVTSPFGQTTTITKMGLQPLDTGAFVPGTYTISAKAYNEVGTNAVVETPLSVKVYAQPTITMTTPTTAGTGSTISLAATYTNVPDTAQVTFKVGDNVVPAVMDKAKSTLSAKVKLGDTPATYDTYLTVQIDPAIAESSITFPGNSVRTLGYTPLKATVTPSQNLLDSGVLTVFKATLKPSWDTRLLPISGNGMMGEWELPDGTIVSGMTLNYTPSDADYALISAGRTPIFRGWLDGAKETTLVTVKTTIKMYEPWTLPDYSFVLKRGGATIIAPDIEQLVLTPSRPVDSKTASYRGVKFTWSLPTGAGIVTQAVRDTVTMTANAAGTYPLSVVVEDKYGNRKDASFSFDAIASTFSVDKVELRANPVSTRVPVMLIPKVATASTHKRERPKQYEMLVDGVVVAAGNQPKPITIAQEGVHQVGVRVSSNFNSSAAKEVSFTAAPNKVPVCAKPFKTLFGKSGTTQTVKVTSQCTDPDGKIKKFSWKINGVDANSMTDAQSYQFLNGVTSAEFEVTLTDDSGGVTTHAEVIKLP